MPFDPSTARPLTKFDPSTAKPLKETPQVNDKSSLVDSIVSHIVKNPEIAKSPLGMAKQFIEFLTPPNPFNPQFLEEKRKFLESAGGAVKEAAQSSLGNLTEKGLNPYLSGALATATELAPFKPSEFATVVAAEASPALAGKVTEPIGASMANRYANAPKLIREGRLSKGVPTEVGNRIGGESGVGEEILKLNQPLPKGKEYLKVPEITSNNKTVAYNQADYGIRKLGNEARKEISRVSSEGASQAPNNANPFTKPQDFPSIRTKDLTEGIDSVIASSRDDGIIQKLENLKQSYLKKDFLNFKEANDLREELGGVVGKSFNKDTSQIPEAIEAQRNMFGILRNKLGQISPKLDEILQRQHALFDVRTSLAPEASLGYSKIPQTLGQLVTSPSKNLGIADLLYNTIPNTRGVGALTELLRKYKSK